MSSRCGVVVGAPALVTIQPFPLPIFDAVAAHRTSIFTALLEARVHLGVIALTHLGPTDIVRRAISAAASAATAGPSDRARGEHRHNAHAGEVTPCFASSVSSKRFVGRYPPSY